MPTPSVYCMVCLFAILLATLPKLSYSFWTQPRQQQKQQQKDSYAKPDSRNRQGTGSSREKFSQDDQRNWNSQGSFAREDVASLEEMYALQYATDALNAYESKPDCFKDAARALRQGCKSIDIDEDEKTHYAIRLTTCEIATASMAVPQECHSLTTAESDPGQQPTSSDIGRCVQSLGRIPQLWTSYSGYFREVKVMCLAVRYSLEHDELRKMQRTLSRTHLDQIALLKEQQRVLTENNRLETLRLKELSDLHSTIATDVNSILSSAGTLRDALRSVREEVSRLAQSIERGTHQQAVALSMTQESNTRVLSEYQENVQSTLASLSQSINQWSDMLQLGLSHTQEINRLSEDSISKMSHSNEALESLAEETTFLHDRMQNLTSTALENTNSLISLHSSGAIQLKATTNQLLQETLLSFQHLESHMYSTWSTMLETLQKNTTEFRTDITKALETTVMEIEQIADESREKVEKLNKVVGEFWEAQEEGTLGRLRPLLGSWDVLKRVVERESGLRGGMGGMVSMAAMLFFGLVGILTLLKGLRTALAPMLISVALSIILEYWKLPSMPFVHLFMAITSLRWCLYMIQSWNYYYNNRHQFFLWQSWVHLWGCCWKITSRFRAKVPEQEQRLLENGQVIDGYEDSLISDACWYSESAEESGDEEVDGVEQVISFPPTPKTPWPISSEPKKRQRHGRDDAVYIGRKSSAATLDMVMESWDLTLGTCVCSSSSSPSDI